MQNIKMTEQERISNLKRIEASYIMYMNSKEEANKKYSAIDPKTNEPIYTKKSLDETITLMDNMINEIVDEYTIYGGDPENLKKLQINDYNEEIRIEDKHEVSENNRLAEVNTIKNSVDKYLETLETNDKNKSKIVLNRSQLYDFDSSKIKEAFDTIPLPSKGECYDNKLSKIPVAYLTAYDENIIASPNLYRDGTFIDYLLKAKILNPYIDPDNLLPGDRDAIILWLRRTGYGDEFPASVTDNETGKVFETVIDLSKINYKEFTLMGDENGWFSYTLPVSKDEIKFTYLTYGELQKLNELEEKENISIRQKELKLMSDKLEYFKKSNISQVVSKQFSKRIDEAIKTINEWYESIDIEADTQISHAVTNKMISSIKSINGITDPKFIKEYVVKMNIRDSSSLRKYMFENEPGVDYTIEVERPKSLGGGSMSTFLTFDQYIFLNYA